MFSNELILLIFENLDSEKDILEFLMTCKCFYNLKHDDLFWRLLIKKRYQIIHKLPNQSWWSLFLSGDATRMCPHLKYNSMEANRQSYMKAIEANKQQICLMSEPDCYQHDCIIMDLSSNHFMEMWCYSCNQPVGYHSDINKPVTEQHLCRRMIDFITELPNNHMCNVIIKKRRLVEQSLLQHYPYTYLIEKNWFTKWVDFLLGKSSKLPGPLDNSVLFNKNGTLKHDLIIGYDYELVDKSIKLYIERVYGLIHNSIIVSGDDYVGKPLYRGIFQSISLHRHLIL